MEVDDSAGHAKLRTSVFFTQFMDVTWGGAKGTKMRSTAATSECLVLGAAEKTVTSQGREHACKLKKKTGDTQHVCLKPSDAPPFCDLDVPPATRLSGKTEESNTGEIVDDILRGCVGKPKGKRQVLWEGDLWADDINGNENAPDHQNVDKFFRGGVPT